MTTLLSSIYRLKQATMINQEQYSFLKGKSPKISLTLLKIKLFENQIPYNLFSTIFRSISQTFPKWKNHFFHYVPFKLTHR